MADKRRILITNDDGLDAPGLSTLVRALWQTGLYDLRVVAPEKEQSGVGHALTLHVPLYAEQATVSDELKEVPAYKVAGTPADCVKIAITNLFPEFKPELVLSGINTGPNVGLNVLYSGTVAGALEACINEMPAVAVSLDVSNDGVWRFPLAAEVVLPIVEQIFEKGLPDWTALNVNIPNRPQEEFRGTKLTRHGISGFKEYYVEEPKEGARRRFRLEGKMILRDSSSEFDAMALSEGWVSVTPLGLCMQQSNALSQLEKWPLWSSF